MPVEMPGQQLTSVSMLGLHKSDMRLLHLAVKISPLIAEAAEEIAVAMAEEEEEHNQHQQASASGRCIALNTSWSLLDA